MLASEAPGRGAGGIGRSGEIVPINLLAALVASAPGSFATTAFLQVVMVTLNEGTWAIRLLLTAGAVLVYSAAVWISFYLLLPTARPALIHLLPFQRKRATRDIRTKARGSQTGD